MKRALGLALGAAVLLAGAPSATASTCATLQADVDAAIDDAVVTAPPGVCQVNVATSNTHSFTLQADPSGSTLEPASPSTPIFEDFAGPHITISGIVFTGMDGNSAIYTDGAGNSVTLENDIITNNNGGSAPSAAQLLRASSVTIDGSNFSGNVGDLQGAVVIGGSPAITVTHNLFNTNLSGRNAGALDISNGTGGGSSPILIARNLFGGTGIFDGNSAADAAGAVSISASHAQPVTIDGNTFQSNRITGSGVSTQDRVGAGLVLAVHANDSSFQVEQSGNRFINNWIDATERPPNTGLKAGGAGEWISGAVVHSTGDVFQGNNVAVADGAPPEGGALGVLGLPPLAAGLPASPGVFVGEDDLFIGNTVAAGGWGGAIYVGGQVYTCQAGCPGSSLTLDDSTVTGNRVAAGIGSEGGALWGSANDSAAVANSIVFGNGAGAGQPEIFGFAPPSVRFSDACTVPGSGAPLAGTGNICSDPLLDPSGKETADSPTIDAGSNALVPPGLITALGGAPRISTGRRSCSGLLPAVVDMGAYEASIGPRPSCPPPIPLRLGSVKASSSAINMVLLCTGAQECRGIASLRTVERRRGHRVRSLVSRRHRVRRVTVTVGRKRFDVAGGAWKFRVPLNRTGRRLLRRFHQVPVRLSVTVTAAGSGKLTLPTRHLTIRAARHRRHHR